MFSEATQFNGDITTWNTANAVNMHSMFSKAVNFNQPIGNWDTGKVSSLANIFKGASSFNQDISQWNTSKVTNMSWAFAGSAEFNQDISGWDVDSVTSMNYLFFNAPKFNQDIGQWDVRSVQSMVHMFNSALAFNQDISGWDVSNVETMGSMFVNAASFDQNLGPWDVRNVENMSVMFNQIALSTENYDSILIAWSQLPLQDSVVFTAGDSKFCAGWEAREQMIQLFNWEIDDRGTAGDVEAICENITVQLDEDGTAVIEATWLDGGSSACSNLSFSATKTTFDCNDLGTLTSELTVTDHYNNSSVCVSNIMVEDAPLFISCPENIVVIANGPDCSAVVEWDEPRYNCNASVSASHLSGQVFPFGTTTVTYTTQDTLNAQECSFTVTVKTDLTIQTEIQSPKCFGFEDGQIDVSISGGLAPYFYDWDLDGMGDYDDLEDQTGLSAGAYILEVRDEWGCIHSQEIMVEQPEELLASSTVTQNSTNTMIDLLVEGGTGSYEYDWDADGTGDFNDPEDLEVTTGGTYTVVIRDATNCTTTHSVDVVITSTKSIDLDRPFQLSPNPNQGVFTVDLGATCQGNAIIEIFDFQGRRLFVESTADCQVPLELTDFKAGTYLLKLSNEQGFRTESFIIMDPR